MIKNTLIEICIGNIEDAITAAKYPIDRIELNSAIELGGLTPSLETLKTLKERISVKICSMVRCRGGNFVYNDLEFETMYKDARNLLENNTDGIVFGFLNKDNTIDVEKTKKMIELVHSYNKEAIFHKAIDEVNDIDTSIDILASLKIDRVLTSGQAVYPDIIGGCKKINELYNKYKNQVQFLPGGGVRVNNIKEVLKIAGTGQIHMTSKKDYPGGYLGLDEEQLKELLKKISEC